MANSTIIRALAAGALLLATSVAAAPSQAASTVYFKSPSGNIYCYMAADDGVRCDAMVHTWADPVVPSCEWEIGDSLYVGSSGRAQWTCHGDTLFGSTNRVLKYGKQLKVGAYQCTSKTVGVRCVNRYTGHGFLISRSRHDRF
jgi:hypothetical protein